MDSLNNKLDITVGSRRPGKYKLSERDKQYLKSFAVDGIIPFNDYIRAINEILKKQ